MEELVLGLKDRMCQFVAWKLPKRVVYWADAITAAEAVADWNWQYDMARREQMSSESETTASN